MFPGKIGPKPTLIHSPSDSTRRTWPTSSTPQVLPACQKASWCSTGGYVIISHGSVLLLSLILTILYYNVHPFPLTHPFGSYGHLSPLERVYFFFPPMQQEISLSLRSLLNETGYQSLSLCPDRNSVVK